MIVSRSICANLVFGRDVCRYHFRELKMFLALEPNQKVQILVGGPATYQQVNVDFESAIAK